MSTKSIAMESMRSPSSQAAISENEERQSRQMQSAAIESGSGGGSASASGGTFETEGGELARIDSEADARAGFLVQNSSTSSSSSGNIPVLTSMALFPIPGSRPAGVDLDSGSTKSRIDQSAADQSLTSSSSQQQNCRPLDPPDYLQPLPIPGLHRGKSGKASGDSPYTNDGARRSSSSHDTLYVPNFHADPHLNNSANNNPGPSQSNQDGTRSMPLVNHFPMPSILETNDGPGPPIQADTNTYSFASLSSLSNADIERHQRSQNGPTAEDPYNPRRLYPFPVPGQRPPRPSNVPPRPEGVSQMLKEYDDVYVHGPGLKSTGGMGPAGISAETITRGWKFKHAEVEQVNTGYRSQENPCETGTSGTSVTPIPGQQQSSSSTSTSQSQSTSNQVITDPFESFLRELPQSSEGPARQAMWTEMIRLKTRTLELQIAEHRRAEKEAELELAKLQQQVKMLASPAINPVGAGDKAGLEIGAGSNEGTGLAVAGGRGKSSGGGLGVMNGQLIHHGLSPRSISTNNHASAGSVGMYQGSNQGSANQGLPQPNNTHQKTHAASHPSPSSFSNYPLVTHARSPLMEGSAFTDQLIPSITALPPHMTAATRGTQAGGAGVVEGGGGGDSGIPAVISGQTPMTPFDLEALLQESSNLDSLFSWLPEIGDAMGHSTHSNDYGMSTTNPASAAAAPGLMVPASDPTLPHIPPSFTTSSLLGMTMDGSGDPFSTATFTSNGSGGPDSGTVTALTSPQKRRSPSPDDSPTSGSQQNQHPTKKAKRPAEKKLVIERNVNCIKCSKPVSRLMFRAPRSQMPNPIHVSLECPDCSGVHQPSSIDPTNPTGQQVGSIETRKRMRTAMEDEDLMAKEENRRCFCDVCHRIVAIGRILGGDEQESINYMCEIVCVSCDGKYQRCTDCGGGGGPRVGIGKWRLKQVFQPGRKTCSLSHSRLGDRPREIGVHVTPTDFTPEQMKEVLSRCKTLWYEKTLSRLAVPEMFEIDLAPNLINPLRNFQDIEDIIARQWPSREAMIKAEGVDGKQFKRLLGLTWAHSRPRRSVRSIDLEEEYARAVETNDDDDMSTVLANVKRTNVVIPAGSELVGMWGGEWDMIHGSLLVSTFIPFEGTDGEDVTALSVGELISKVQGLQQKINKETMEVAKKNGEKSPQLLPQCEHLWVVSGGNMPLIKERMTDILIRKRAFVHVEEYLTRHPEFINALNARPVGLHPDLNRPLPHQVTSNPEYTMPHPLVLVRWLGKDFDAAKILEIKQLEFGGGAKARAKLKKMPKSRG